MTSTFTVEAYQHMREHAGYGYRPTVETADQGRVHSALALARAEFVARASGAWFAWEDDPDGYLSAGNAEGPFFGCRLIVSCECCGHDQERASLWAIDQPSDAYRRVVEAELALEAGLCHPLDRAL